MGITASHDADAARQRMASADAAGWSQDAKYTYHGGRGSGFGKRTHRDGDVYEGEVLEEEAQGKGTYTYASTGTVYTGQWQKNRMHGTGRTEFGNGDVYEGEMDTDLFHGRGKMVYAADSTDTPGRAGDTYDGMWRKSDWHGRGKLTRKDGSVQEGDWRKNELQPAAAFSAAPAAL